MDVPRNVDLLNCEHVILLETPAFMGVPGFVMAIFGAEDVALLHLNPSVIKPDGYRLIGTE